MNERGLLRTQIIESWKSAIENDYHRQRINSERSLQASFWSKLNNILHPETRRLFIEPTLQADIEQADGSKKIESKFPDIVVCNTREVIGIIELKYQPRAEPSWEKDLNTFEWIQKNREHLTVQNERYHGLQSDNRKYKLAENFLFVWAGVHLPWKNSLSNHFPKEFLGWFLELHAETQDDNHPKLRDS